MSMGSCENPSGCAFCVPNPCESFSNLPCHMQHKFKLFSLNFWALFTQESTISEVTYAFSTTPFCGINATRMEVERIRAECIIKSRLWTSVIVAGVVAANICSCGGSTTLMTFVTHADTNTRLNTMRLLSLLSIHIGDDIAAALRSTLQLKYLKDVLLLHRKALSEEHIAVATILANTPLTEFEVRLRSHPQVG